VKHATSLLTAFTAAALGLAACALGVEAKAAPANGLLGHWRFDSIRGQVAKDSSGAGRHGTIHNGKWVRGRFGTAMHYNGETTYVTLPALAELDGSDELTVEAWVLWQGAGRYPNILTAGAWNPGGFLLFVSDGYCSFRMGKPGKEPWTPGKDWQEVGAVLVKPFDLGRWYHLAATFKRPLITTYVDGVAVGSATWPFPVGQTGDMHLGRWALDQGKTQSHYGLIDEVKIYRRALRADEIKSSYEQGAAERK